MKIVFEIEVDAEDLINEVGLAKAKELCINKISVDEIEDLLWYDLSSNIDNIPVAFRKLEIK